MTNIISIEDLKRADSEADVIWHRRVIVLSSAIKNLFSPEDGACVLDELIDIAFATAACPVEDITADYLDIIGGEAELDAHPAADFVNVRPATGAEIERFHMSVLGRAVEHLWRLQADHGVDFVTLLKAKETP